MQEARVTDDVGPLLVRAGLLGPAELRAAYEAAAEAGSTLVEQLVAESILDEERLCEFFRERLLVPRVGQADLERVRRSVLELVPREMAIAFRCLPLAADAHGNLALAMMDPSHTHAVDEVRFYTAMTVYRVVAPASAVAWALREHHGAGTRLTPLAVLAGAALDGDEEPEPLRKRLPPAQIVEDVYGEDTPIPLAVPFDETTGRVVLIDPRSLSTALTDAARAPYSQSEAALREAVKVLGRAGDRDAVALATVGFLHKLCRRAAFFVVRRGQVGELAGFTGAGVGVRAAALRAATLSLDVPSTFRDLVRTRLPYRGPLIDAPSRDFLIEALGWAPVEALAVPLSVRERVVGILYADERTHALPDDHLSALARAAELALERVILAAKRS
jgi:hypothetical protein